MKKFLIALLVLAIPFSLHAAEGFSSLEEQMTGKEFMDAGLDKLSKEELASLNAWIRRHSLATIDAPAGVAPAAAATPQSDEDRRGFEAKAKEKEEDDDRPITSRIAGAFDGWDGQTTFRLENGQIWAQADKDKFYTKDMQNPSVTIKKGMFGSWYLSVDGYNSKCKVRRIQ